MEYLKEEFFGYTTLIQHDDQILELRNKVNKYYKSCYIHYREILRQELFLGMITLCLENGIRQKLKVLESNIEKQEEYMEKSP